MNDRKLTEEENNCFDRNLSRAERRRALRKLMKGKPKVNATGYGDNRAMRRGHQSRWEV